nr:unnamed protein product [Callosobruchus analis]
MIRCEVDAILIKVASLGLDIKHLGRSLSLMQPHLLAMHEKYGLNVKDSEVVIHSDDPIAPVGYLIFKKLELETKLPPLDLLDRLAGLPLKDSDGYVTDEGEEAYKCTMNDAGENAKFAMNLIPVLHQQQIHEFVDGFSSRSNLTSVKQKFDGKLLFYIYQT